MSTFRFVLIIKAFIHFINLTTCQRRIINGHEVESGVGYMVYLVKAPQSERLYTGWLCGGSIVHPMYILTSAACVEDVQHVYVISGYRKYVDSDNIEKDPCTRRMKKRIVYTCFPYDSGLDAMKSNRWNKRDVCVAKMDSPFKFYDTDYLKYCTHLPTMVKINFLEEFVKPGQEAIAYGWGHSKHFRPEGDYQDYNEKYLRYTPTTIMNRLDCYNMYEPKHRYVAKNMWDSMFCTYEAGKINDHGKRLTSDIELRNSCSRRKAGENATCNDDLLMYHSRQPQLTFSPSRRKEYNFSEIYGNGICQNDHGGPLVRWIGGKEYLIGVATGFLVTKSMECRGPFLWTSTLCNAYFIYCVITGSKYNRRSTNCNASVYENIVEREISWDDYTPRTEKQKVDLDYQVYD